MCQDVHGGKSADLEHGGDRQQEGAKVGVLSALLCASIYMQPNDGKDNHEEQDECGDGQERCCRRQQHLSDLTQALHQQWRGLRKIARYTVSHELT